MLSVRQALQQDSMRIWHIYESLSFSRSGGLLSFILTNLLLMISLLARSLSIFLVLIEKFEDFVYF